MKNRWINGNFSHRSLSVDNETKFSCLRSEKSMRIERRECVAFDFRIISSVIVSTTIIVESYNGGCDWFVKPVYTASPSSDMCKNNEILQAWKHPLSQYDIKESVRKENVKKKSVENAIVEGKLPWQRRIFFAISFHKMSEKTNQKCSRLRLSQLY